MLSVGGRAKLGFFDSAATLKAKRNSPTNSPDVSKPELSNRAIIVFVALQALDVVTTLVGLRTGAQEANIIVARLMHLGPMTGLLIAKLVGFLLIIPVFVGGRAHLIRLLNFWFAGIVIWNLVMIGTQHWVVLTR